MPTFDYEYTEFLKHPNVRLFVIDLVHSHVHMHKEFELCYLFEGEAVIAMDGENTLYGAGDFVLLNSRQIHEIYAANCEHARILSLQVSPVFCANYFPEINNLSFDRADISDVIDAQNLNRLKSLLIDLSTHYFTMERYSPFHCVADTCMILCLLLECIPWHHITEIEKVDMQIIGSRLNRIVSYIEENYTNKILLKDIARMEKLSLDYLSHFFKEHFTLSFQEYVAKLRFEKARLLLRKTDMSLTSISIAAGFCDCRQMKRVFKALADCSPEDYRDMIPKESGLYYTRPINSIETELDDAQALRTIRGHLMSEKAQARDGENQNSELFS